MNKVQVIIPTYNESENITKLLTSLNNERQAIQLVGFELHILVADDKSPDGTANIVEQLKAIIPNLEVKLGNKQGLGAAYKRVFDDVIAEDKFDCVITMDADFSHDPAVVKLLLKEISEGASFAIGSRYIEGGSIPGNWPMKRIVNTRVANYVARYLGGIEPKIKDLTAGFRAFRVDALRDINFSGKNASGYSFQINLSNEMSKSGRKIVEVPIKFTDRAAGESKIRFKDITNFIQVAWHLNGDSSLKQLLRYFLVGLSGVIVNLVSLWFLRQQGVNSVLSIVLALELSIISNFIGHSLLTFRSTKQYQAHQIKKYYTRVAAFQGASTVGAIIIFVTAISLDAVGIHYIFAQLNGILLAVIINYLFSSRLIWSPFIQNA